MGAFKEPHGGTLKELYLGEAAAEAEKQKAIDYQSWDLTERQICDLELLLNGAFSPLEGFLTEAEYDGVLDNMRLPDGTLWPMPVNLDVSEAFAAGIETGQTIALRDREGVLVATLEISDKWQPDKAREARLAFGSEDQLHPAVNYLMNIAGPVYLAIFVAQIIGMNIAQKMKDDYA